MESETCLKFTPFSSVSVVDFEQVDVSWVLSLFSLPTIRHNKDTIQNCRYTKPIDIPLNLSSFSEKT